MAYQLIQKQEKNSNLISDALTILAASLFLALSAQISIPLPFSPVPITGQTLAVLFIGATLGSVKGTLAVLTYLCEALIGFPVLAGGATGLAFFGPRLGYLIGMPFQAYLAGQFTQQNNTTFKTFCGLGIACGIQLGLGVCALAGFVGWSKAFWMGLYPFLPIEILKIGMVTAYIKNNKDL